jgi:hypothetical protein
MRENKIACRILLWRWNNNENEITEIGFKEVTGEVVSC